MSKLSDELGALTDERREYLKERLGELLDLQAELLGEPTGVRPEPRHTPTSDQVSDAAEAVDNAEQPPLWGDKQADSPSRTVGLSRSVHWELKGEDRSARAHDFKRGMVRLLRNPTGQMTSFDIWSLHLSGPTAADHRTATQAAVASSVPFSLALLYPTQLDAIEAASELLIAAEKTADAAIRASALDDAITALTAVRVHPSILIPRVSDYLEPASLSNLMHRVQDEAEDFLGADSETHDR